MVEDYGEKRVTWDKKGKKENKEQRKKIVQYERGESCWG